MTSKLTTQSNHHHYFPCQQKKKNQTKDFVLSFLEDVTETIKVAIDGTNDA